MAQDRFSCTMLITSAYGVNAYMMNGPCWQKVPTCDLEVPCVLLCLYFVYLGARLAKCISRRTIFLDKGSPQRSLRLIGAMKLACKF